MPIHWRPRIEIEEEKRYGRAWSEEELAALKQMFFGRDVQYTQPEHLKHLSTDELLIRLRETLKK